MLRKFMPGTPKRDKPEPKAPPRSTEDINKQYSAICQQTGQKYLELKQVEYTALQAMNNLSQELEERNKLDAETTKKNEEVRDAEKKAN